MKKNVLNSIIISGMLTAGAVFAGDMGPVETNEWTGLYAGGNLGGSWGNKTLNVRSATIFQNPLLSPVGLSYGPAAAVATTASIPLNSSGLLGGVQAGYNYRVTPLLLAGIEGDFQAIGHGQNRRLTRVAPRVGFPPLTVTGNLGVTQRTEYLGTVRGRLGVIIPNHDSFLAYVTGGLAVGGVHASTTLGGGLTQTSPFTTDFSGFRNVSTIQTGYTVGGGVEMLLTSQFSVKLEYLYYDLGTLTYKGRSSAVSLFGLQGAGINFINRTTSRIRFDENVIRLGVNLHLA